MPAQLSWTLLYSARPLEAFRMRMPVSPLLCTLLPRSTASLSNVSPMYRPASLPEASFSMKRLPTESKLVIPYSPLAVVRVWSTDRLPAPKPGSRCPRSRLRGCR